MKKIILPLAVVALMFSSCKKDYTCSCTITNVTTGGGSNSQTEQSVETTFLKVSKKFMKEKAECVSTESTSSYQVPTGEFDPITFEPVYVTVTTVTSSDCKIEK